MNSQIERLECLDTLPSGASCTRVDFRDRLSGLTLASLTTDPASGLSSIDAVNLHGVGPATARRWIIAVEMAVRECTEKQA